MGLTRKTIVLASFVMSLAQAGPYTPHDVARFFSTRIVGGEEAPRDFAPYMVALVFGEQVKNLMCGGTVVNTGVIVTAAHCVDALLWFDQLIPSLRGVLGSNKWASTYKQVEFKTYKKHPNYDPWNIKYDVAVLITKTKIRFSKLVQPIRLKFEWVHGGEESYLTGWGMIGQTETEGVISINSVPDKLQMLQVSTLTPRECIERVKAAAVLWGPAPPVNPDVEICTLHSPGHGACMGDSGSGLVSKSTGEQIGVVSWGFRCARGAPDMFARLSGMEDFLRDYVDKTE